MDIRTMGKPGAPAVLLLGNADDSFALLSETFTGLEKEYFLLFPVFDTSEDREARARALETALLEGYAGRIWGAYGLREGAALLLDVFVRGRIFCRTAVLEGAFALSGPVYGNAVGRMICWINAKDKAAKASWEALRGRVRGVSSLTMKKLKKDRTFGEIRPDLAVKRLKKEFGTAVIVTSTDVLPQRSETVWRELNTHVPRAELKALKEKEPTLCLSDDYVMIQNGRSPRLSHWSHMTRLESLGEDGTICTDQVELDAGKLNALAKPLAALYLKALHARRRRALKKG